MIAGAVLTAALAGLLWETEKKEGIAFYLTCAAILAAGFIFKSL